MITQIEIDGFKTFKDFKVELAPFQVIVGPNGSGKSNLFDALHLLSRLADVDLRTAFQELRGDADELFTLLPNGQRVDRIRMAVEILVDRNVRDNRGGELELVGTAARRREVALKYTRLRYELEISVGTEGDDLGQLHVTHECLKSIPQNEDNWCKKYELSSQNNWLPKLTDDQATFIDTKLTLIAILESISNKSTSQVEGPMLYLYPDSDEQGRIKRFYALEVQSTVLSRTDNIDYPHTFAAREELHSLKFLHLNPEALRQPTSVKAPTFLSRDGSNLPTTLARMQTEDRFLLNDVSRDLANLVPDVVGVELKKDPVENKYTIWVKYEDGRSFPSPVLSDGTLRLLALATLKNDPQFYGVLCFEEPENAVHPSYLNEIAHLLRGLATDFSDPQQVDEPLRQVLVTTHSPAFISQPDAINALLFTYTTTRVEPRKYAFQITQMVPVVTSNTQSKLEAEIDKAEETYTIHQIERYLDTGYLDEARTNLGRR